MTLLVTLNAVVCYEYCTRNSTAHITSLLHGSKLYNKCVRNNANSPHYITSSNSALPQAQTHLVFTKLLVHEGVVLVWGRRQSLAPQVTQIFWHHNVCDICKNRFRNLCGPFVHNKVWNPTFGWKYLWNFKAVPRQIVNSTTAYSWVPKVISMPPSQPPPFSRSFLNTSHSTSHHFRHPVYKMCKGGGPRHANFFSTSKFYQTDTA